MRLITKFWLGWLLLWWLIGVVAGVLLWVRFPFLLYFLVGFFVFSSIGMVPASYALLFIRFKRARARIVLTLVYLFAIAAAYYAGPVYRAAHEDPQNQGPYLTWSDDPRTTVTVSWTTKTPSASLVQYKMPGAPSFATASSEAPTPFHHVTLGELRPATTYEYTIPAIDAGPFTFRTAPTGPEDFSFVVYGDTRPWLGMTRHRKVVNAILKKDKETPFRFIINTGDIVENPGEGFGWQWYVFLKQITPLAKSRPYLISLGNHEARGSLDTVEQYFAYPNNQFWYSYDYAGVHFVSVSTQHTLAPGSEQHTWLEDDLKQYAAKSRFTILSLHKPFLTYDPRESYHGKDIRANLVPLLKKYRVPISFAGHVHAYEHLRLGDHHLVITGGGGVLLWAKPTVGPETVCTETTFHFCAVAVRGNTLHITAYRDDGSVIEAFEVEGHSAGAFD